MYNGRYLDLTLDLKKLKQLLTNVIFLLYLVRDSATIFILVVCSSSEVIPCTYQYTVSGMITLKS